MWAKSFVAHGKPQQRTSGAFHWKLYRRIRCSESWERADACQIIHTCQGNAICDLICQTIYNNIVHICAYNMYINKCILWIIPTRWSAELHTVVLSFLRWDLECWPENNTQGTVSTYHMYYRYETSTVHARCSITWHVLHLYIKTCHTRNMSLYISTCTMLNARVQCHQYGLTYAIANEHHFTICRLSFFALHWCQRREKFSEPNIETLGFNSTILYKNYFDQNYFEEGIA